MDQKTILYNDSSVGSMDFTRINKERLIETFSNIIYRSSTLINQIIRYNEVLTSNQNKWYVDGYSSKRLGPPK